MIISMKRLTLIAHKDDEQAILKALQRLNAVEIISAGEEAADEGVLAGLEEQVAKTSDALAALKPYAPKKGLLDPTPETTAAALMEALTKGLEDSGRVEELVREASEIRSRKEKNLALLDQLAPWKSFPADMKTYAASKKVRYFTGLMVSQDVDKLKAHEDILEYQVFSEGGNQAVLVACEAEDAKQVQAVLKSLQWTDVVFPKLSGTPGAAMAALEEDNRKLAARQEELAAELKELGVCAEEIGRANDAAVIERDRARASQELARTAATFHLEGWVREDEVEKVKKAIASVTDACMVDVRDPDEDEVPPSVVKNGDFAQPFEAVTNLYSRPDPNGIDGTPYMAPFYVLLFGLMLSDTGYGIVLAIGCWLFTKFLKPTGMMGSLAKVIFWGGLSTIVWGVLIGTFFGLDFDVVFGTNNIFPLLVDPMEEPIGMLILCFGLGIVHLIAGVIIKMKMSFDRGDWQTAIFDNLSWILIIVGLIVFVALPALKIVGLVMLLAGVLMILLFKGREKKNVFSRTISGLGELYQVTSYLSDVLSYSRLFALGIATGVIASVFNDICSMLMGSPNIVMKILGIAVACALLVFLHLFNIFINTLGAFVHCARLQYVEFYGKFYEAGGKEFRPLGMKTKHVRLLEE